MLRDTEEKSTTNASLQGNEPWFLVSLRKLKLMDSMATENRFRLSTQAVKTRSTRQITGYLSLT